MGGGVTLMVMPLIFAAFVGAGYVDAVAWRYSMIVPGIALFVMGIVYYFTTQDTPDGNLAELRKTNPDYRLKAKEASGTFSIALRDYRVWVLFLTYGASFGIEITIDNIASLYFVDNFNLGLKEAGLIAGLFGMLNIFARALGGIFGDMAGKKFGLKGRIFILGAFMLCEGLGIMLFSSMDLLPWAIATMLLFALFLKMSNGATYSVVPFINSKGVGVVSGIVGAGGNVGAVLAGFLFKMEGVSYRESLFIMGIIVSAISILAFLLTMTKKVSGENMVPKPEAALTEAFAYADKN